VDKLTPKQEQFCQEYLIDLNGTQAMIRAGYSEKTAPQIASEYLRKPNVAKRIAQLKAERAKKTQITAATALTELSRISSSNILDFVKFNDEGKPEWDLTQVTREQMAAVSSMTIDKDGNLKVTFWDKNKALSEIGKHVGVGQKIDVTSGSLRS
jgi:phage terminase small subunit